MGIFTSSSGRRGRTTVAADQADAFKPILTPENSAIPGQVVVQLHASASGQVTAAIGTSAAPTANVPTATSFGIAAVDKALAKIGVTAITRLHPPAPPAATITADVAEVAEPMASTYRVYYSGDVTPEKAVAALAGAAGVEMAEVVRYRETLAVPNDPQFPSQWGLTRIHCPQAWDRTTGQAGIIVAVVDTGVDLDHPELAPLLVQGRDFVNLGASPTPPAGFHFEGDFNTVDNDPMDEVGHGTHVAGTIACLSNNGTGVAGVTWQCRIMPVRVLARIVNNANPADVRGTGSSADIAAGIRWAVDHGARVINMSLGGPSDTFVERDAVAYAIAHGVVVCAAMGNGGLGAATSFPAAYPDVVAVGAIDQSDHRASFSQVGPHIDVVGPGVGVLSTVWNNSFTTMSGTSMATPHVAGVAALILSIKPSLTAAQCADILRQTADPLKDSAADPVPNNNYGWGCVNAFAAVNRASPPVSTAILCTSRTIVCRSVAIACPSVTIVCQSVSVSCPSHTIVCQSQPVVCHTSPILCHVNTSPVICQVASATVLCAPSAATFCPSVACHPGGNPGDPIFQPGGQIGLLSADDPYAPDYGNDPAE
jgi:subtilisin family serine protease